jgi:hypothetical protein
MFDYDWKHKLDISTFTDQTKKVLLEYNSENMVEMLEKLNSVFMNQDKSFKRTLDKITEIVEPYGMKYGDEFGGFATGTKWHNEDKTLYLGWNTWWNYIWIKIQPELNSDFDKSTFYWIQYPLPNGGKVL